jgi:hypothetical protein
MRPSSMSFLNASKREFGVDAAIRLDAHGTAALGKAVHVADFDARQQKIVDGAFCGFQVWEHEVQSASHEDLLGPP